MILKRLSFSSIRGKFGFSMGKKALMNGSLSPTLESAKLSGVGVVSSLREDED
jgi:hypothetical protein